MYLLALETSCDETACAILKDGRALVTSVVASQMDIHARYGGVFPEVASRQHVLSITPVIAQALSNAGITLNDVEAIAVTRGPGLPGSLVVGLNAAKGLALGLGKPLIGVNHLEGHIYSAWLYEAVEQNPPPEPQFPLVALLVSGGHTELNLMRGHLDYQRLGATLDDAAGEAFDKVARLLKLPYPGGPMIEKEARNGNPAAFDFPRAWLEGTYNFSFSGLKTAVLREVRRLEAEGRVLPVADLAASFQAAVIEVLYVKTMQAARQYGVREIVVGGGVSANAALRQAFLRQNEFKVHIPPLKYCTDNAAMVAAAGYARFRMGQVSGMEIDVLPTWPLS
ncbi:MAG: tRNA (adenosine(37)-N6)-threonylcarbamoyltransferase complex transferase subunit TsaD [Anaerolineales bacterium]|nr:tRNA (adenosine(37)-N6)-threonylcarbamoyltransferase complex transferase subunit TsaD [Anaerolineales bacterium]MCX7754813.1 tRNA (adenosine(37)-N6)-threonylcarbamoyltransferase complex transferase subunit TsaD [Anaerolineales bacterium]MDW8277813.1 tRNA (adenosine(37)-N6)-threonylcarbamoyltransferase complex transferase subunit TsaD [Anaerolineales bacterium]